MELPEEINKLRTPNIETIMSLYFDELMAINSIIYKYDICVCSIINNDSLLLSLLFENQDECDKIANITDNVVIFRYGKKFQLNSKYINTRTIFVNVQKLD